MIARARVLSVPLLLAVLVLPAVGRAQTAPNPVQPAPAAPAAPPASGQPSSGTQSSSGQPFTGSQSSSAVMPPPAPLQAPTGIRPFPTPPQVTGRELLLDEAVQLGLENAPRILAAAGDYLAARQRVYEALAPLLPQLTGQWNGFWQQNVTSTAILTGTNLAPGARVPQRTVYTNALSTTATVTASQLLFDFGKSWAATDAAKSSAESFRQTVELQRQTIAVNVKTSYFTLLLAKRLVGVNIAALDRADLNLKSARGFFEVGTQPRFFVTRAEVDVANARVSLIQAQNAVALARVSLNTAMGIAVNTSTEVKDILAYEPYTVDRDALVTDALRSRPDYLATKALFDAQSATVRQRFRNFFPSIFASGTYGSARSDMNEIYSYGLQLNWTLFDGGNLIAQYKEAKATLDALQARVRDFELSVWQDVQQAYLNMIAAEQQIGAAQKAVDSAQENFRLSQGRFDAGVGTIIELTDAQLSLTQAQSNEAQALANYRIAIAQLERAVGRR